MDVRAAKLALARQKLKDHQVRKNVQKDDKSEILSMQSHHQFIETSGNIPVNKNHDNQKKMESDAPVLNLPIANTKLLDSDINVTEILVSNKINLEKQVNELHLKLTELEHNYSLAIESDKASKQLISNLENALKNLSEKNQIVTGDLIIKNQTIEDLNKTKLSLTDENNNLCEQLDFTKAILFEKESENATLRNQLNSYQNQLDVMQLQLQQLTNGCPVDLKQDNHSIIEQNEALLQKISYLEQQLKLLQKEKEQTNINYEHYVNELNEQLRSVLMKNEQLAKVVANQTARENSLVEQIGDMEIRLQNYKAKNVTYEQSNIQVAFKDLQNKYEDSLEKIKELTLQYDELKNQYIKNEAKVKEIGQVNINECSHDNISLQKLNADITSDKVALQRATEQNKKLKKDLQELEEDFVKMTKDKLALTEKLTAEKYLNRELTIKLAEIDENAKDMKTKLMAKDEEMIRLQASYREIEKTFDHIGVIPENSEGPLNSFANNHQVHQENENHTDCEHTEIEHVCEHDSLIDSTHEEKKLNIAKEDAMLKLQARFYKIMEEVADLSDEKHRLEHIILQLQNETETICEYVALYQQQRSLLKKRDEERSAQIKLFQIECERLKRQIEELTGILIRIAEDKALTSYFQVEARSIDKKRIMNLLSELKNNSLVDPKRNSLELNNFYPCNCCSGQLIDL